MNTTATLNHAAAAPVTSNRKSEAGFSLIELLASTILLIIGMLFFAGLFGSAMASYVKTQRTRIGKTYAESGMGDFAARARKAPSTAPRTEPAIWSSLTNYADLGGGSIKKTTPNGWDAGAYSTQQILSGDGYIEVTPPANAAGIVLYGPSGWRGLNFGFGNPSIGVWMGIYEDGTDVSDTCCTAPFIAPHLGGDRYRMEVKNGKLLYWRIRNNAASLMYTSTNPLPGYPLSLSLANYNQNDSMQNTIMSGNLSDPTVLADGGNLTPGSACTYPYCDYVWQPQRTGATQPPPLTLKPDATAPQGAMLLFVRRFRVTTVDSATRVRQIDMTLAETTAAQPFLTRTTRILANK